MLKIGRDTITFSRKTWEELRNDEYFRELVEIIEDREALREAKEKSEYFVDFNEYHKKKNELKYEI